MTAVSTLSRLEASSLALRMRLDTLTRQVADGRKGPHYGDIAPQARLAIDLRADMARRDVWQDTIDSTLARTSVTQNAMQRMADIAPWRPDVDHLFVSASLGLLKPDPAIFELVAERLGLDAADIAFIDDRAGNVEAAAALGWRTHLWHDDADTREWLERLGGV